MKKLKKCYKTYLTNSKKYDIISTVKERDKK